MGKVEVGEDVAEARLGFSAEVAEVPQK